METLILLRCGLDVRLDRPVRFIGRRCGRTHRTDGPLRVLIGVSARRHGLRSASRLLRADHLEHRLLRRSLLSGRARRSGLLARLDGTFRSASGSTAFRTRRRCPRFLLRRSLLRLCRIPENALPREPGGLKGLRFHRSLRCLRREMPACALDFLIFQRTGGSLSFQPEESEEHRVLHVQFFREFINSHFRHTAFRSPLPLSICFSKVLHPVHRPRHAAACRSNGPNFPHRRRL